MKRMGKEAQEWQEGQEVWGLVFWCKVYKTGGMTARKVELGSAAFSGIGLGFTVNRALQLDVELQSYTCVVCFGCGCECVLGGMPFHFWIEDPGCHYVYGCWVSGFVIILEWVLSLGVKFQDRDHA